MVIAAVLLLLYAYRRRLFILWWITGWLLLSTSMFLAARPYANQKLGWMAYGASQFLAILSSLSFVIAADAYRHRPLLRRGTASCCCRSRSGSRSRPWRSDRYAVFAPGHLLIAGGMATAASRTCCCFARRACSAPAWSAWRCCSSPA